MFSDKIKYNTPLPGDEFRSRDLAIPAEAAKVLFEIDFQYGQDKELCLSILTKVFRGTESVTEILRGSEKIIQKENPDEGWRHEATIERALKVSMLEQEQAEESRTIKTVSQILLGLGGRERMLQSQMARVREVPATARLGSAQGEMGGVATPGRTMRTEGGG